MNKRALQWISGIIILLLVLILGWREWARRDLEKEQELPAQNMIQAEYPEKIVYLSTIPDLLPDLQQDCSTRNGTFNSCGTSCAPDAEICTDSCAYTCELTPEPDHPAEATPIIWETYSFPKTKFTLRYPKNILDHTEENGALLLSHAVPYDHQDPCDFQGGAPDLKNLTDFEVRFELFEKDLKTIVTEKEGPSFVQEYLGTGQMKTSPGFIDPYTIGTLKGSQVTMGVENCGLYHYYFPLSDGKTLFVERSFITMMRDETMRKKVQNLPNVFLPEKEENWFKAILQTFQQKREE